MIKDEGNFHKVTCSGCGASWWASGRVGGGSKNRCDDCIEQDAKDHREKMQQRGAVSAKQKPFTMSRDLSGMYTIGSYFGVLDVQNGLRYSAFDPGTKFKCRRKDGVEMPGGMIRLGVEVIVKINHDVAQLLSIRGDVVYYETRVVVPARATFEELCRYDRTHPG
jgi:hypothetical protein